MGSFYPVAIEAFVVIVLVGNIASFWRFLGSFLSQPTTQVKAVLVLGLRRILKHW